MIACPNCNSKEWHQIHRKSKNERAISDYVKTKLVGYKQKRPSRSLEGGNKG